MPDVEMGGKPALSSKTVNFNWISGLAIPMIWPFIPQNFKNQDNAINIITAWFTIGNIILRFLTKEAVYLYAKKGEKSNGPEKQ